jgi:hypothetical protein
MSPKELVLGDELLDLGCKVDTQEEFRKAVLDATRTMWAYRQFVRRYPILRELSKMLDSEGTEESSDQMVPN